MKHELTYDRLYKSIVKFIKLTIAGSNYSNEINNEFLEPEEDVIPTYLYLSENVSEFEREEAGDEIKGAIRFIASLSCIDGLVVLTPNLTVKGFGTVIKGAKMPEKVYVSYKSIVTDTNLSTISPDEFGTRHRSMFSYCWNHVGSLGFVVSQDGDIRAITKVGDKLIMWENIKVLQFLRSTKLRRPIRPNMKGISPQP